jgi:hypothetical protein
VSSIQIKKKLNKINVEIFFYVNKTTPNGPYRTNSTLKKLIKVVLNCKCPRIMFTLVRVLRLVVHIFFYRSPFEYTSGKTILFDF